MVRKLDKLRDGVAEWLHHHDLDGDIAFVMPEEWRSRGEPYLGKSELILVFEGGSIMS
jgi:hypothetical protein